MREPTALDPPSPPRPRPPRLWIFTLALVLRVLAVAWHLREGFTEPDEHAFLALARSLAEHGAFRSADAAMPEILYGPVYPAFVACFLLLFGGSVAAPLLAQALLGAATASALARGLGDLLRRAGPDERLAARVETRAGLALAASPYALLYERMLMSEGLATALLAGACLTWMRAAERRTVAGHVRWMAVAGGVFGVLALTKAALLGLPAAFLAVEAGRGGLRRPGRLGGLAVFAAVAALAMAPWALRNRAIAGSLVPVTTGGGVFLYLATLPADSSGLPVIDDEADRAQLSRYRSPLASAAEKLAIDRDFRTRARARIARRPFSYALSCGVRMVRLWAASHTSVLKRLPPRPVRFAAALFSAVLVAAASAAVIAMPAILRQALAVFWVVPLYVTIAHAPLASGARYAVPAWPYVLCLAGIGFARSQREVSRVKVLLVDDDESNRDMLSRRLQHRGYEVITAVDGRDALERARAEGPGLILMDVTLPVLDGLAATRELKSTPGLRHIPVIALTAHAEPEDRDRARAAGCDDYDTKPIEFARLEGKMETLLRQAAARSV